jgi:hypothetical protein
MNLRRTYISKVVRLFVANWSWHEGGVRRERDNAGPLKTFIRVQKYFSSQPIIKKRGNGFRQLVHRSLFVHRSFESIDVHQ